MEKKISAMLMKAIMFLAILIFLIPILLLAGTTGKIAGKVIDKSSGNPLPGANVVIRGTSMGASTDSKGEYFIINIPPGSYSVSTSFIGYDRLTTSDVRVMADRTINVNFALTPSVLEGESVIVIAERPIIETDVTASQNILDAARINRAPIADIKDAMKEQTGIYYTGETTYIRGGLASEINYILDGASLNSGLVSDNYQRLNITAIEEVSVLTGGYNAEYGQAMSGVVNVITKEASASTKGIHGTMKYRMRPAGLYHWGKNMYDRSLYKYTYYDTLGYWEARLNNSRQQRTYAKYFQRFYGPGTKTNDPYWDGVNVPTAQQLRDTYMEQLTSDEILSDYANRMEHCQDAIRGVLTFFLNQNLTIRNTIFREKSAIIINTTGFSVENNYTITL